MQIQVRLFATLRQLAGWSQQPLELPAGATLEDALAASYLQLSEGGFALDLHQSEDLPLINADVSALSRAMQNLLSNALKFSDKEQCVIRIGCEKKAAHFLFSVSDNGMGIPPEWQDKVFLPFHRLAHKGKSGAGLGLAICDKIVRLYGGTIWVKSEPGDGSTFYFTLPVG